MHTTGMRNPVETPLALTRREFRRFAFILLVGAPLFFAGSKWAIMPAIPYILTVLMYGAFLYGLAQTLRGNYFAPAWVLSLFCGLEIVLRLYVPHSRWSMMSYYSLACGIAVLLRELLIGRGLPKGTGTTEKFFMVYAVWSAATILLTDDYFRAGVVLLKILSGASIFLLLRASRPSPRQMRSLLGAFFVGHQWFILVSLGDWVSRGQLESLRRVRFSAPGYGSNDSGNLFGAGLMISVALLINSRGLLQRLLFLSTTGISIWAVLATMTRGAIIAVFVGTLTVFLITARHRPETLIAGLFVLLLVYPSFIIVEHQSGGYLSRRLEKAKIPTRTSRGGIWGTGLISFYKHPIAGTGIGSYYNVFEALNPIYRLSHRSRGTPAHNETIRVLVESGLMGVALFLAFHASILMQVLRHRKALSATIGVQLGFLAYVAVSGMGTCYRLRFTYLLLALTLCGWRAHARGSEPADARGGTRRSANATT